jgi:hypothetical protein
MPPELLSTQELADRIDARPDEILEWVRMGYIPAIKTGRSYFYNLGSVVEAIRRVRHERAAEAERREAVASC